MKQEGKLNLSPSNNKKSMFKNRKPSPSKNDEFDLQEGISAKIKQTKIDKDMLSSDISPRSGGGRKLPNFGAS